MTKDLLKYLSAPHGHALKKYTLDLLKERYSKHEKFLDKISRHIQTEEDLHDFGKLLMDSYEAGFMRAFKEYREQVEKLGYDLKIKPQETPAKAEPIFNQSEKSG